MHRDTSEALYARACQSIPGGVNSPVRAFKGVGGTPIFFESALGPFLYDVDGNEYIDYVASWGPMLQGFGFSPVVAAVTKQASKAMSFGAPTQVEIELAELVIERMPSIERVRMVNSGTEATMSAIRLARGVTGRDKIVKFEGCFHGHGDSLLVKAGSGILTLGLPDSPGVPADLAQHTLTLPFNNVIALDEMFAEVGSSIAAVIVEPIAGNMGCIPANRDFLAKLRTLTAEYGALLIFDEVMTGFRVAKGGAQELFAIDPDITTLGKVIGAGLPVGAFGGKAQYMDQLAPIGAIYQSGTLSGNPLAMQAGLALLKSLDDVFYETLLDRTNTLVDGLRARATSHGLPIHVNSACGMFSFFFTTHESVEDYSDVAACDVDHYRRFFHAMLAQHIYFAPSAFESAFVSGSHENHIIQRTLDAADTVFANFNGHD